MTRLDDVLLGADPNDIRAIQKLILEHGGQLDDPAWVPFAAAYRLKLETQRIVPEAVRAAVDKVSQDSVTRFHSAITTQAASALRELAQKAANTPLQESTRRATWLVAVACLAASFLGGSITTLGAGALFRELGWSHPPGLAAPDQERLAWARHFDDPAQRDAALWAITNGFQKRDVRAAIDWLLERRLVDPLRRDAADWSLAPAGQFARRFMAANDYLLKGECPSQSVDRSTGKWTCMVWHVAPR